MPRTGSKNVELNLEGIITKFNNDNKTIIAGGLAKLMSKTNMEKKLESRKMLLEKDLNDYMKEKDDLALMHELSSRIRQLKQKNTEHHLIELLRKVGQKYLNK